MMMAASLAATTRSKSLDSCSCFHVGLRTSSPSMWPMRTAPIGPSKGISEIPSAAEAPLIASTAGSVS